MEYQAQTSADHYEGKAYRSSERWSSYWHQLELIYKVTPHSVLEIGVGSGVVARELRASGIEVTTCDIAEDLHPDVVGSITKLPFADDSFDLVLAAEILEHIHFDDVPSALQEITRVTKKHAVVSLPHPGYVFSFINKIPLLPRFSFLQKIPFFWKTHVFNGEHYWELGKRGYSLKRFLRETKRAGLSLTFSRSFPDDPAHRFFVFEKKL